MYYTLTNDFQAIEVKDVTVWGRVHSRCPIRVLEQTYVGEDKVSTVFLGLVIQPGKGHPLLWETMIFGGKHDSFQRRYETAYEAKLGHDVAAGMVRSDS